MRTHALWILAASLVALPGLGCATKRTERQTTVAVTVARAEVQSVPYEIEATGTVEPLRTVAVLSQVSGVLTRVAFREGAEVARGQVLFQIDPRPFRAALDQALANLARDRAQLDRALPEEERYSDLAKKSFVTQSEYEEKRATAAALRSTVRADSAAVENARLNLEYATIRAPISGRTGSLLIREGNLVQAGRSDPLVVINQIRPILVRFTVPERHLTEILRARGRQLPVFVRAAEQDSAPRPGKLTFVDNNVDPATGTVLLKAELPNMDGAMWPGRFVTVKLVLSVDPTALVIPAQAVTVGQSGTSTVFVVQTDNTVESRAVTVSRTAGSYAVISSGVQAGEQVVTDGQFRLSPGSKVAIKGGAEPSAPAGGKPGA